MTKEKFYFEENKLYQSTPCTSCGGDGLYKRHTSYTVNGKPICFRCKGSGWIKRKIARYNRLYKVGGKLVPASKRPSKKTTNKNKSTTSCWDVIPF